MTPETKFTLTIVLAIILMAAMWSIMLLV